MPYRIRPRKRIVINDPPEKARQVRVQIQEDPQMFGLAVMIFVAGALLFIWGMILYASGTMHSDPPRATKEALMYVGVGLVVVIISYMIFSIA